MTNLLGQRVKMSERQMLVFNYIGTKQFTVSITDTMNDTLTELVKMAMVCIVRRAPDHTVYQRI